MWSFVTGFFSHNIMFSRLSMLNVSTDTFIPLYGWIIFYCIYAYHILLTHSSVDRHLCAFHFLAIRNNAAPYLYMYIYGCMCIYLGVELLVARTVKASAYNAGDLGSIPGWGRSLEKEMATHSSIVAWKIPWTKEPDRLQPMGSQSWTQLSDFTSPHFTSW